MDKNYTVVETSKIAAVRGSGHIHNLIHTDDVENGHVGYVGDFDTTIDGHEVYEFGVFDTDTINKKQAVLVANPEWNYDEGRLQNQALYNYINEKGVPFRAYDLTSMDGFAVTAGAFDGTPAVGKYVILSAGKTKYKIVDTEAETKDYGFVGKIEWSKDKSYGWTKSGGGTYGKRVTVYYVHVLRNEVILTAAAASTPVVETYTACSSSLSAFDPDTVYYTESGGVYTQVASDAVFDSTKTYYTKS